MNRQLMTTSRASGTHLDRTVNSKRSEVSLSVVCCNLLRKKYILWYVEAQYTDCVEEFVVKGQPKDHTGATYVSIDKWALYEYGIIW